MIFFTKWLFQGPKPQEPKRSHEPNLDKKILLRHGDDKLNEYIVIYSLFLPKGQNFNNEFFNISGENEIIM